MVHPVMDFVMQEDETPANSSSSSPGAGVYEDQAFLGSQSGTALLDKFTHCLLVKCPEGMLDRYSTQNST